ncbi:hypothetical protein F5876DRAFT_63297 [Lentinula aff. lateritia]|uniref:Uncharacterized protein n=1 Tax=Lentinula aff. lateritia TaxID=2804960 RepID=A0ACC1U8F8_9AGAR|nr:hypothetical protein F5876DRAFT_63297 [Lentinula aff. lateritia]
MDVDVLIQSIAQPRASKSPVILPVTSPANGKPKSPPADVETLPSPPSANSTAHPASALASMLTDAFVQIESLKETLKKEKSRADHFEVLARDYKDLLGEGSRPDAERNQTENAKGDDKNDIPMDISRSKDPASQLTAAAEKIRQLRESLTAAEEVRDEEMARRILITDLWAQLNQYIERLESTGKDARLGFDRIVKSGGGIIRDTNGIFKDIPQLAEGDLMRVDRNYNANGVLQPLASTSSRRHDYPREERHGTRRPRSGSMDAYAYSLGPNSKRVRYQDEHPHHHPSGNVVSPTYYQPSPHSQHPPPPGGSNHPLSPTSHIQQHQHTILQNMPYTQPPPLAAASSSSGSGSRHRDRRHTDPAAMHAPEQQSNVYPVPGPPGYDHTYRSQDHSRAYRDDRQRRRRDRSRSYSRGRSPSHGSEGSMDLDEMLLATTGDEQHLQANGNGLPGPPQVLVAGRGKGRPLSSHGGLIYDPRDGSQYVPQPSQYPLSPHAQHLSAHHSSQHIGGPPPPPHVIQYGQNPQPGPPSGRQSPPFNPSSRPSSSRRVLRSEPTLRDDLDRREGSLSQSTAPGQVQYQTHVFAPVQTGAPVKKSKFNNASGNVSTANVAEESQAKSPAPNPAPVAVTSSTSSLPLASVNLAPATSPFPPTNEQGQRICRQCGMPGRYKEGKCVEKWGPGPMGPGTVCDRCRKKMKRVERRGTIEQAQLLAAQQAQNRSQTNIGSTSSYGSFPTPQRENSSAKLHRTDTVIIESGRHAFEEPTVSSIRSTSNARIVTSSPFNKSSKSGSRPTSKAASRAGSIVDGSKGSRRSSPVPSSRSNLGTSMTMMHTSRNHASNVSVHSNGSGSGMDIDADADGDAEADLDDAEAEVEGDIAALVDQAAPSPLRPRPGSKPRNDEDVDIAALAGVDDDPDDYDSPATTHALRRQQAVRAAGGGMSAYGVSVSGKTAGEVTSGPGADAELDILEAVDAAEANSASSSTLKVEDP